MTVRLPTWLVAASALLACSAPRPRVVEPLAGTPAAPASPAVRWSFHPLEPPAPHATAWPAPIAELRLDAEHCVVLTPGGQRWLVATASSADCSGRARASASLAGEELTHLARRADGSWLFAGMSGAIYEAPEPLAPFTRALPSLREPLLRLATAGDAILALTRQGRVLRLAGDAGWREVALEAPATPRHAFDLASDGTSRALVITVPEALFTSADGGASWSRAALPPMGLARLGSRAGALLAEGPLEAVAWQGPSPRLDRVKPALAAPPELKLEPDLAADFAGTPSAEAVLDGRAALDGEHYFEARRPLPPAREGQSWSERYEAAQRPWRAEGMGQEDWLLASGSFEGPLRTRPIPHSRDCASIALAASGTRLAALCVLEVAEQETPRPAPARVLRSLDGGASWEKAANDLVVPPSPWRSSAARLAVAHDGTVLVAGACLAAQRACEPAAPLRLAGAPGSALAPARVAAPSGSAAWPAFAPDGEHAYFLSQSATGEAALFVSRDGGASFAPRSLARVAELSEQRACASPALDGSAQEPAPRLQVPARAQLHAAADGTVGFQLLTAAGSHYVTTDADGLVLDVSAAPAGVATPSGHGRRVIAQVRHIALRPAALAVELWESHDGGASWAQLDAPPAVQRALGSSAHEELATACSAAGCLFGTTFTRVGWPVLRAQPQASCWQPRVEVGWKGPAPITCTLRPAAEWSQVVNEVDDRFQGPEPGSTAQRGDSEWSALVRTAGDGFALRASLRPAPGAAPGKPVERPLLPAVRGRSVFALESAAAGQAVARVKLPAAITHKGDFAAEGMRLVNVELAFHNWMDGSSGRGVIADAGKLTEGSLAYPRSFLPELLAVAAGGAFFRPYAERGAARPTFLLRASGAVERIEFPSWQSLGLPELFGSAWVRDETALLAAGRPLAAGFIAGSSERAAAVSLVLAHRPASDGAWKLALATVAPPAERGRLVFQGWTYAGATQGLATLVVDPEPLAAWALFQPLRDDGTLGPAQPLPTPLELGDVPRACTAAERTTTARLEVPLFAADPGAALGARRALFPRLIRPVLHRSDASAPVSELEVLMTDAVVLHGTPSAPCVAGFTAHGSQGEAILGGDLQRSWLFDRMLALGSAPPPEADADVMGVAPMECRLDPAAEVPFRALHLLELSGAR